MKFWLVCFLVLFFGVEGMQWLSHLPWLGGVEFSLPTVLIGGIGLAIASNYRYLQSLGLLPAEQSPQLSKDTTPGLPGAQAQPQPHTQPGQKPISNSSQTKSISFEIHRPGRSSERAS